MTSAKSVEEQRKLVEDLAKRTERHDRVLTDAQAKDLLNRLRIFPGQRYWIVTENSPGDSTSEQMRFSAQFAEILVAAGWKSDQYPTSNPKMPMPLFGQVRNSGSRIGFQAGNPAQMHVAQELASALAQASVDSMLVAFCAFRPGQHRTYSPVVNLY